MIKKRKITNSSTTEKKQSNVIDRSKMNIVIPDTNVLVQDPDSLNEFLKGNNLLSIPWQVFLELDNLKRSHDVGWEAQKVIKKIHALILAKANLVIERKTQFSDSSLDKTVPDHRIVAAVAAVIKNKNGNAKSPYYGYGKVKLVSNDYGMQIVAMEVIKNSDFSVEFYKRDITRLREESLRLMTKNIPASEIKKDKDRREYYQLLKKDRISYGVPVLVYSGNDGDWKAHCVATRRENRLVFLDRNITASKIKAKANGGPNWQQIAALNFLMDDSVSAVFLQGGAGTGKTLLALAAGIHQKRQKKYDQLIVMRPTVYLSEDDNLGYIPGDIDQKMAPWFLSIKQNLDVIFPSQKNANKKEKEGEEVESMMGFAKAGIEIQPLGYIRGSSFENCFIIIEEAQNLPRHMIKTILTRPAKGTKMVFTGDLGQIDNRRLTKESSGLAYAIARMKNAPLVGIVNFEQTLRSPLASLADKIL